LAVQEDKKKKNDKRSGFGFWDHRVGVWPTVGYLFIDTPEAY